MQSWKMFLFLLTVAMHYGPVRCDFELVIAHTNDVHSHIEEFNKFGGLCTNLSSCYGGVARRYTYIQDLRKRHKNVVLLDGGDQFQGTMWFNVYKGQASAELMNYLQYDAMAVGNHEFDLGPAALQNFIKTTNFSVLSSNIETSAELGWPKNLMIKKSVVLKRNGIQIGIIGYTTQDTKWLSSPGKNIKFDDVLKSIELEAKRLKQAGVGVLIALGHAGIEMDKLIGQKVKEIDVVVGGHSNTFLYNGDPPSNDKIDGPYPIIYTREDGSRALVVQDYAYGKYIGYLKVIFDNRGQVKTWSGNPVLLSAQYDQDQDVMKLVKNLSGPIVKQRRALVGRSLVYLDGNSKTCRQKECNLGNLITDAIVKESQRTPDEKQWASIVLGLWNGGGIRSSIIKNATDFISAEELYAVLPFGNTADITEIKGKDLLAIFEHSVSKMPGLAGRFLQVSGFKVEYDIKKKVGNRVVMVTALCMECRVPRYIPLDDEAIYKVVMSSYLIDGGDEYVVRYIKHHPGEDAFVLLRDYVKSESPVTPIVEGRIVFKNSPTIPCSCSCLCANKILLFTFYLLCTFFFS